MNILHTIRASRAAARERKEASVREADALRKQDDVQVMVYENALYISIKGTPVLNVQDLKNPDNFVDVLNGIRTTMSEYEARERSKNRLFEMGGLR